MLKSLCPLTGVWIVGVDRASFDWRLRRERIIFRLAYCRLRAASSGSLHLDTIVLLSAVPLNAVIMFRCWRLVLFLAVCGAWSLASVTPNCVRFVPELIPSLTDVRMITFTYSGEINREVRGTLSKIFTEEMKNPDQCPIRITIFSVSEDSDPCSLHKMYIRGNEIALSGLQQTGRVDNWNLKKWNDSIVGQQELISNISHIRKGDIQGMRAQNFKPGNNSQFEMLNINSFAYDSSLLVDQKGSDKTLPPGYFWPFLMKNETLDVLTCLPAPCPNDTFKGLWEVPGSKLYIDDNDKTGCPYLDMCLGDNPKVGEVTNILNYNYEASKNCENAPLQVNIRKQLLDSPEAVKGLKEFVEDRNKEGAWIIALQDLVEWMNVPTENRLLEKGFWNCPKRDYIQCSEAESNDMLKKVTFATIIDVNKIWIWQTVFLIVLYIVVYRYDKEMAAKKK